MDENRWPETKDPWTAHELEILRSAVHRDQPGGRGDVVRTWAQVLSFMNEEKRAGRLRSRRKYEAVDLGRVFKGKCAITSPRFGREAQGGAGVRWTDAELDKLKELVRTVPRGKAKGRTEHQADWRAIAAEMTKAKIAREFPSSRNFTPELCKNIYQAFEKKNAPNNPPAERQPRRPESPAAGPVNPVRKTARPARQPHQRLGPQRPEAIPRSPSPRQRSLPEFMPMPPRMMEPVPRGYDVPWGVAQPAPRYAQPPPIFQPQPMRPAVQAAYSRMGDQFMAPLPPIVGFRGPTPMQPPTIANPAMMGPLPMMEMRPPPPIMDRGGYSSMMGPPMEMAMKDHPGMMGPPMGDPGMGIGGEPPQMIEAPPMMSGHPMNRGNQLMLEAPSMAGPMPWQDGGGGLFQPPAGPQGPGNPFDQSRALMPP